MINLRRDFCLKARDARRKAGLTQSELADEIGCKQSALSMFEQGDGTKLNDDAVKSIAKKFGLEMSPTEEAEAPKAVAVMKTPFTGFCPNPHCPSNVPYQIDGRTLYRPDRHLADPIGGRYCALCGELLERNCPNCGTPVHDGAICSICGEQYVSH